MIRVKRLVPHAQLPQRQHESAGYDLHARQDVTIPPGQVGKVPLGFAADFPAYLVAIIKDRSSMGAKGLHCFAGVVDSDYRGEWAVLIYNSTGTPFDIKSGDRVAQVLFVPVEHHPVGDVEELGATTRGEGGFGSTGR